MKSDESLFWVWLAEAFGAGNGEFRTLLGMYDTPYNIFSASAEELDRLTCVPERIKVALSNKDLREATRIVDACERLNIGILTFSSPLYPQLLREIKNPPLLLYCAGTVPKLDRIPAIAMVGTRRMSAYGMRTAYKIAYELSAVGMTVISGMAAGIDGVCAAATLEAGGFPIAVLGCGLDRAYPSGHAPLMTAIGRHGLLLSEYPPGSRPISYHFPVRNRIISALSQGVVVVEAGLGSGSLITAKEAVMQGKEVYAIPSGAEGIGEAGAESLLRDGAHFASCTEDILNGYLYTFADRLHPERLRQAESHSAVNTAALERYGVLGSRTVILKRRDDASAAEPIGTRARVVPEAPKPREAAKTVPEKSRCETVPSADLPQGLSAVGTVLMGKLIAAGKAVSLDELVDAEVSYGQALSELTLLELRGCVAKQPGGLYRKI